MYEGTRTYTPSYVLTDSAVALRTGTKHLELEPPITLAEALSMLRLQPSSTIK